MTMSLCPACGAPLPESAVCPQCEPRAEPVPDTEPEPALVAAPPPAPPAAWRSGALLILGADAPLPDACFKCGAVAPGSRFRRRLSWHHPSLYLLLIHPLIYLIVAIATRKRKDVALPLCDLHRRRRRLGLTLAWVLVPLGLIAAITGLVVDLLAVALLGLYAFLIGTILAVSARVGRVEHIDREHIRLRGADLALLDQLPDWSTYR